MADFGLHWVRTLHARRHDYPESPLQLELYTGYADDLDALPHAVTLYLHNDALTKDLVEAINAVVAKHQQPAPQLEAAE